MFDPSSEPPILLDLTSSLGDTVIHRGCHCQLEMLTAKLALYRSSRRAIVV